MPKRARMAFNWFTIRVRGVLAERHSIDGRIAHQPEDRVRPALADIVTRF